MGLTNLTIESPTEGEKATIVPIGVKDDEVSVEVINLLTGTGSGAPTVLMTIHKQRGGRYWYYWVLLIGGTIFVIAYYATDGFGVGT